jgi:tetratricopeptide (TPR) repeat protein
MRLERRARFELLRTRWRRAKSLNGPARRLLEDRARDDLKRLVALGGRYPAWATYDLWRMARDLDDEPTALAAAREWERLSANNPLAAMPLFSTELRLGAYEKAASTARRLLQAAPNDAEVANRISSAEYKRQFYRAALQACLDALRIDPKNATARKNLTVLKGQLRSASSVNRYLLEKLRLKEALILVRLGRHSEAVQLARRLVPAEAGGDTLLALACVESLASLAARKDMRLLGARRTELADRYARNAVHSLTRAKEKGYFNDPRHTTLRETEEDLAALQGRPDFQRLFGRGGGK